jgi:hypothetical protein
VALTEVEVLEIEFDSLDKIYENVPDYLKSIISCVAERLRKANETIRRLQRNVVSEGGEETQVKEEGLDAASILAATSETGKKDGSEPK